MIIYKEKSLEGSEKKIFESIFNVQRDIFSYSSGNRS